MSFQVLTKKEAAERARCSPRFLEKRIAAGEIAATRLGRKVLIRSDVLRAWLVQHTAPQQDRAAA